MEFIRDIYLRKEAQGEPVISFEFFPFKTPEAESRFHQKSLPALMELSPDYCSVTYGAGGSTQDKTLDIVGGIQQQYQLIAMAHLTCVAATRERISGVLQEAKDRDIKNILALRGDPPVGQEHWQATAGGFEYSYQLVNFIRETGGFGIGAAGFPEGHIACQEGKHVDWGHLKHKIDCGVDFVITQLFFDNQDFYEFRDHLVKQLGVTIPICAGVLPILSASQIKRFTQMCGAKIPDQMLQTLNKIGEDNKAAKEYGIEYATMQCEDLLNNKVPGIHFYTLNQARSTTRILQNLGLA